MKYSCLISKQDAAISPTRPWARRLSLAGFRVRVAGVAAGAVLCVGGGCSWGFGKIGGGTPVPGPLFCRVGGLGPAALLGGEGGSPGASVFFKFCQISKSNFFTERLWATASEVA